jgi:uncharacterized membrane protein YraQ (UPF0718 family)
MPQGSILINTLKEVKSGLNFIANVLKTSWDLLVDSSVYIVFGLMVAGLLRVFLNPGSVAKHLGQGRFVSVFKAAILGIPIPL